MWGMFEMCDCFRESEAKNESNQMFSVVSDNRAWIGNYINLKGWDVFIQKYLYRQSQCSKTWDSKCLALIAQ